MSRWERFKAKPVHVDMTEFGLEEGLDIYPLKVKDMDMLDRLRESKNKGRAVAEVIMASLRDPALTIEEILEWDVPFEEKLMEAVITANGKDDKEDQPVRTSGIFTEATTK